MGQDPRSGASRFASFAPNWKHRRSRPAPLPRKRRPKQARPSPVERERKWPACNLNWISIQGENPLMRVCVDAHIIGEVISGWTGIPVGKMMKDEIATVLELESHLGRRVIGQNHALELIAERIRTSRSSLDDPEQAHRRLHAGRPQRRRQDGDRSVARRPALRRRAQPDHHQHVRISGSAHRFDLEGLASGLRRLRRRRRADRSRAPASVLGGAAR